ncbi:MAG: hypothetical protein AAGA75_04345 [Cyanobacteria bacterium P01_E01_bin.6]
MCGEFNLDAVDLRFSVRVLFGTAETDIKNVVESCAQLLRMEGYVVSFGRSRSYSPLPIKINGAQ